MYFITILFYRSISNHFTHHLRCFSFQLIINTNMIESLSKIAEFTVFRKGLKKMFYSLYTIYVFYNIRFFSQHCFFINPRIMRIIHSEPFHVDFFLLSFAQHFFHEINVGIGDSCQLVFVESTGYRFPAIILFQ